MVREPGRFGFRVTGLFAVSRLAHRGSRARHQEADAWASVRLTYTEQADGLLPVGVVRVQNPAPAPVIVAVCLRPPRTPWARRGRWAWVRPPLSLRVPRAGRRPSPWEGTLLGAVDARTVRTWEVPLGGSGRLPVVEVNLHQVGPRTRVFVWALEGTAATGAKVVRDPRPALTE